MRLFTPPVRRPATPGDPTWRRRQCRIQRTRYSSPCPRWRLRAGSCLAQTPTRSSMTLLPRSTGAILRGRGETFVAGKRQELLNELWNLFEKCHRDNKRQAREECYAGVVSLPAGSRSEVGDEVVVLEAEMTLGKEGLHPKLAHNKCWTGSLRDNRAAGLQPGLNYGVLIYGLDSRRRCQRRTSKRSMRGRWSCPTTLEAKHGRQTWDWRPPLVSPLYTLTDRRAVRARRDS